MDKVRETGLGEGNAERGWKVGKGRTKGEDARREVLTWKGVSLEWGPEETVKSRVR